MGSTHLVLGFLFMALGTEPLVAQGTAPQSFPWTGVWVGEFTNVPERPGAPRVTVTREIGVLGPGDRDCAAWRTRYEEAGVETQVKDYKICRSGGVLVLDEGRGARLPVRVVGDVLVASFRLKDVVLMATTRLTGDRLVEEVWSFRVGSSNDDPIPLHPLSVQRLELRRAEDAKF